MEVIVEGTMVVPASGFIAYVRGHLVDDCSLHVGLSCRRGGPSTWRCVHIVNNRVLHGRI